MNIWQIKKKHVIERISERSDHLKSGLDAESEYARIQQTLEKYVPADWRLTRFSGDFLILDLTLGITLVGHQLRKAKSADIIKVVNTALITGGFSKGKLGKHSGDPNAFEIAKRPNLFIGDETIHEIFKATPILSRQYEKVYYRTISTEFKAGMKTFARHVLAKSPIEYFRLHPLTAKGLDLNHHVWMKSVYSDIYNCRYSIEKGNPPKDYHGEDFWHLEMG